MPGKKIHGHNTRIGKSPEYRAWDNMMARCYRPRHESYKNYGALGVTVCERWRKSFIAFLADVGKRPSSRYSLDRKDGKKSYEPSNCKWSTRSQQNSNVRLHRRNKKFSIAKGVVFARNGYQAQLTVLGTGKQKYLGRFKTKKDAIHAVKEETCRQNAS